MLARWEKGHKGIWLYRCRRVDERHEPLAVFRWELQHACRQPLKMLAAPRFAPACATLRA